MLLELDQKGNIWLILILLDLCPNQQETRIFQRSMIDMRTNRVCLFNDDNQPGNPQLSRREIEILGLLAKGMLSKEIADRLFISVNTVNNHRQKIIEKMDVANTSEALSYAEKIGII
jgi:DNA-binding CsgD family transcriptional regulator